MSHQGFCNTVTAILLMSHRGFCNTGNCHSLQANAIRVRHTLRGDVSEEMLTADTSASSSLSTVCPCCTGLDTALLAAAISSATLVLGASSLGSGLPPPSLA